MAWRQPGDNNDLNKWWLFYQRIYVSLGLNELIVVSEYENVNMS